MNDKLINVIMIINCCQIADVSERNKVMEEKYREVLQQYGQQMEESQTFMGQKASLKTQLKQKSGK